MKIRWALARVGSIPTARTNLQNDPKITQNWDSDRAERGKLDRAGIARTCKLTAERLSCWPPECRSGFGHRQDLIKTLASASRPSSVVRIHVGQPATAGRGANGGAARIPAACTSTVQRRSARVAECAARRDRPHGNKAIGKYEAHSGRIHLRARRCGGEGSREGVAPCSATARLRISSLGSCSANRASSSGPMQPSCPAACRTW